MTACECKGLLVVTVLINSTSSISATVGSMSFFLVAASLFCFTLTAVSFQSQQAVIINKKLQKPTIHFLPITKQQTDTLTGEH